MCTSRGNKQMKLWSIMLYLPAKKFKLVHFKILGKCVFVQIPQYPSRLEGF